MLRSGNDGESFKIAGHTLTVAQLAVHREALGE
jgi:hypothetical protein